MVYPQELASALGQEKELYDRYRDELKAQYDAKFQDMLDAMSRIYDLDPTAPIIYKESDVLPEVYEDWISAYTDILTCG